MIIEEQVATVMSCYTQMKRHTDLHTRNTQMIIKVRANTSASLIANLLQGGKPDDNGWLN